MQRTDCPNCLETQIIIHNHARNHQWKCKQCGKSVANDAVVVIKFGNHYRSETGWTTDVSLAQPFTFTDAENARITALSQNQIYEVWTVNAAQVYEDRLEAQRKKNSFYYTFESELHQVMADQGTPINDYTYHINGVGSLVDLLFHGYYPLWEKDDTPPNQAAVLFYASHQPSPRKHVKKILAKENKS